MHEGPVSDSGGLVVHESLRRLIDGTCCLLGEDQMAAYELFSQVRTMIEEHIRSEDLGCLKVVTDPYAPGPLIVASRAMLDKHRQIEKLIHLAQIELENAHGHDFRNALCKLVTSFDEHHSN